MHHRASNIRVGGPTKIGRLLVPIDDVGEHDLDRAGDREREQDPEQPADLSTDQQHDDHCNRREADLLTDDLGGDDVALEALHDSEDHEHTDKRPPPCPFDHDDQHREHEANGEPEVRDHVQQPRDDPQREPIEDRMPRGTERDPQPHAIH